MKPFLTLHHPARARRYYEDGLWQSNSFYDLVVRNCDRTPDAPALKDGRVLVTWSELRDWTGAVAAEFASHGLVAGDRVSIWMSNRAEAIVAFLACSRAGLACNPSLHKTYTCQEIITLLRGLQTSILITEPGWGTDRGQADFDSMLGSVSSLKGVYEPQNFPRQSGKPLPEVVSDPDTVGYLAFTSGTTGTPKCVMHSANTLLANARDLACDWELGSDARLLSLSPLSHHIAWVGVAQWLLTGCLFITNDAPDGTHQIDWLLDNKTTYAMGVPTHAMDILGEQERRGLTSLGDLDVFYMAGSPIPPVVAEAFVKLGIKPQNIYGMTENSSHQYTHRSDDLTTWTTTCGRGGCAYEVRIFDVEDPNKTVNAGEVGQICGHGAALMLGYYDNQEATASSFNDKGWFMSGDLGALDENGNLSVEGRLKDLIIRGGHNIYPAHIEVLAQRHPQIEKVAAFPVADDRLGERVCLAILGTATADAVLCHLADEGLSKYDMPEYFVRLGEFPLTASGKILKRELIEMVKRGEIDPEPVRYRPSKESA